MKPIIDAIAGIVILAIVINVLATIIAPYAAYLVAALVLTIIFGYALKRFRQY